MAEQELMTMDQEDDEDSLPVYSWDEIKKHNNSASLWMVIHGKVYDVTKFMEEHPGGEEVLLEQAGRDGTEAFEDVGHSPDAREIQQNYLIGQLDPGSKGKSNIPIRTTPIVPEVNNNSNNWLFTFGLIGAVAAIAAVVYRVFFSQS